MSYPLIRIKESLKPWYTILNCIWAYHSLLLIGVEAATMENKGSILRDFVAGKLPIAFEASILMHFMHKSDVDTSALLKSSIASL